MKKLILRDEEYEILCKVLRAVPPAQLPRVLPDWDGGDMHYYRCLLSKVLNADYHFPKTDEGLPSFAPMFEHLQPVVMELDEDNPGMKKKLKDGKDTPLSECVPESEVEW